MNRATIHHLKDLNPQKAARYGLFLEDYSKFTIAVVEHIWRFGYKGFSVRDKNLSLPSFLDYKDFDFIRSDLSARAKSSAVTQASQIIRSSVEKQRRVLWVQENKNVDVKDKKFSKPKLKFVKPSLSSKCADFQKSKNGKFLGFIRIKSVGKKYGSITLPVSKNPNAFGEMLSGFFFNKDSVQICWDKPTAPTKATDKILAIDQGLKDVATCSDGQVTQHECPHGHTLSSIIDKLSRKKKGSKAFKRAEAHRKNFVNWSINNLNFDGVKEVRLEKIVNIRFKKKTSRKMSHWSNPEIRDKILRRCEELEVPVVEQSCAYRSQRCSKCGHTRKANRKGKQYICKHCGYCGDADYNAAMNHLTDLPSVPNAILVQRLNLRKGFFWNPDGFKSYDGVELRVPHSEN
jgi:transposase